jgi:hypothetical protein
MSRIDQVSSRGAYEPSQETGNDEKLAQRSSATNKADRSDSNARSSQSDNSPFTSERAAQTALHLPGYALTAPKAKPTVPEGAGTDWLIRKLDVNPASNSPVAKGGAQGDPLSYGMKAQQPNGSLTSAAHVLDGQAERSPFISASEKPLGAPNFGVNRSTEMLQRQSGPTPVGLRPSEPFLIDVSKLKQTGAQVVTTPQLLSDLDAYRAANPSYGQIDVTKANVERIEGETLVRGDVPADAVSKPNANHLDAIRKAEGIYEAARAQEPRLRGLDLIERVEPQLKALEASVKASDNLATTLSRGSKALGVLGTAATVYDVGNAVKKSYDTGSAAPVAAEALRQGGGWGGAVGGAWLGAQAGAALGAPTGPGAVVSGLVGGIVGGAIGYFGADAAADQIDKN